MNMTFTLEVTLQGRLSDGEYVCSSTCPMWDCCQNGLKMSEACPIRKWVRTQTNKVAIGQGLPKVPEVVTTESAPLHTAEANPWPERITNFLIEHDLTQKAFGDLVGADQASVSNWRNGDHQPRERSVRKLNKVFKTFKREDNCETA